VANGQTERFNKLLTDMLSIYTEEYHQNWDEYLPLVAFAYNSSTHEATKISPFKVVYGKELRFPIEIGLGTANYTGTGLSKASLASDIKTNFREILDLVKESTEIAQHKMMRRADKIQTPVEYWVGEKVWLYVPTKTNTIRNKNNVEERKAAKLKFPWQGPYEVIKQVNANVVKLRYNDGTQLGQNVHVNRLKPYKERQPLEVPDLTEKDNFDPVEEPIIDKTELAEDEENPSNELEVQDITGHKVKKGKLWYLTTFTDGTTSWQPKENFYSHDGEVITEAINKYFELVSKPFLPALHAQITKLKTQFKAQIIPFLLPRNSWKHSLEENHHTFNTPYPAKRTMND